jgi:hypothetical protein
MVPSRNPKLSADRTPAAALDYEIAQEMAAALGRHGRRLERSLLVLAQFDETVTVDGQSRDRERRILVADAGDALWHFMVQREACGLRDSRQVMRDYRVPPEVQYRMGILGISDQGSGVRKRPGVPDS